MQFLNGTRIGAFLQTLLYLTGSPTFQSDNNAQELYASSSSSLTRALFQHQYHYNLHSHADLNHTHTKCYGVLGCTRMKYPTQRGFELFPADLAQIKPSICLQIYGSRQCQFVDMMDEEMRLRSLLLNTDGGGVKRSYWIAHGYFENGKRHWIQEMVDELLEHENAANVFVVDWGRGAEPPYTQAIANIELIGAYLGYIMIRLEEGHGAQVTHAHFIGHSLGAHLGGVVGSWLNARGYALGRISGLDPAQPYFELFPPDARLDLTDATFVDVIHTDATPLLYGGALTGLGTEEPSGHVDFYPNEGKDQPGCNDGVVQAIVQEKGSFLYGIRRFIGCNHIRAYEYFTESIRSNCSFMAFRCESYNSFVSSKCEPNCDLNDLVGCNRMGFHAQAPRAPVGGSSHSHSIEQTQYWRNGVDAVLPAKDSILYYSITGNRGPYCREHLLITLHFAGPIIFNIMSDLSLNLIGPRGVLEQVTLDGSFLYGGPTIRYTIPSDSVHHLASLNITMQPIVSNPISWLANMIGKTYNLSILSMQVRHIETGNTATLCPPPGQSVLNLSEPKSKILLTPNSCT